MLLNDPTSAVSLTLLAGSDANLNGTVNVIGDVRTTARVDIGGTLEIQTAAKPFRLSGGDLTDANTLVGGTINGPGLLGADTGSSLYRLRHHQCQTSILTAVPTCWPTTGR